MLSPGSSKVAPCATNSLVTVSKVVRCALVKAEKILYSSKFYYDPSSQNSKLKLLQSRLNFQKKIYEIRILLSRLLVVIRWSKKMYKSSNNSIVDGLFSGPEIHIQNTFYKINQYLMNFKPKPSIHRPLSNSLLLLKPNSTAKNAINLIHSIRNAFQVERKDWILLFHEQINKLFNRGVPKRIQKFCKNGQKLFFIAPGEYSFVLRISKNGNLRLLSYKIQTPKEFNFPEDLIELLTKLLVSATKQINSALSKIDRLLHSFYLYCSFGRILKLLYDNRSNYPIRFEGSLFPPSVKLILPTLYGPLSSFRFGIQMGRLIVSSIGTVYLPPTINRPNNRLIDSDFLFPLGTFNRFDRNPDQNADQKAPSDNPESYHFQISFEIKNDFNAPNVLLSFLRDTAFYTKFVKIWKTSIHVIRSISFPYFNSHIIYNDKMSTFGRIEIYLKNNSIVIVNLDSWTSVINLHFSENFVSRLPSLTFTTVEPERISEIMLKVLTNFTVHKAVESVYGIKIPTNVFIENPKRYSRCFSFAPDFSLRFHTNYGHPHVRILDNSNNQYTSPDIVEMDSSTNINAWKLLEKTLRSSKDLIFLLQIKKNLQENGIQSVRTGRLLTIILPMCRSCSLQVNQYGWRLFYSSFDTFGRIKVSDELTSTNASLDLNWRSNELDHKAILDAIALFSTNEIEMSTVIHGCNNFARSAQIVAHVVSNLHQSRYNFFNIMMLSKRTMAIEKPYLANSNEMLIRFQNDAKNTMSLSFGKRLKHCGVCHEISFFEMDTISIPEFEVNFLSLTPIQWIIKNVIPNSNDIFALSSFINHSAIPFLKFSEVFSNNQITSSTGFESNERSNGFNIMPISNSLLFSLVYKNRYSLTFQMKPFHSFLVDVPRHQSIFLIIPLSTVKKECVFPHKHLLFEVPMSNLEKLRDAIVIFVDFYEEVIRLEFKFNGFSKNMDQVTFQFDKTVKMLLLISGESFKLNFRNSNEISEVIFKITQNSGLDPLLLRGIVHVITMFSNPPFQCSQDPQIINKFVLHALSLVRFLMEKLNLPLVSVSKMLNSLCCDNNNMFMNSIPTLIMNVEKSRSEKYTISFEVNQNNITELKTMFLLNGMQPTLIKDFDDLLVLIKQQNEYLSVF